MKPINIVLPCWKGDQHQAEWLLEWIGQMGMVSAPFWLLCDNECRVNNLLQLANKAFTQVKWMEDKERLKSNWHEAGDHPKSAAGPNSLFRQAAWTFELGKMGPWMFLEPDAIPCRKDWYEIISREYQMGGKPIMGFLVTPQNHPGVPQHLSGVAVYPENMAAQCPGAVRPADVAFDIAGVEQILPRASKTQVIYHKYRAPGFTSMEDFNARVPEHIAVWHSVKDGSIYQYLRQRFGMAGKITTIQENDSTSTSIIAGHAAVSITPRPNGAPVLDQSVDIFIKTRPHDYPWLEWCNKSIDAFVSGFRSCIQLHDESTSEWPVFPSIGIRITAPKKEPGYLWQQVCKLYADQHTDAEYILYMDSDCVFTRPVTPDDFLKDGKPIWLYTPLDKARSDQHVWVPVMEKFLGKKPEHEFMRRHPFIVQRWMLEEFRKFTQYRHGKSLEEYIMGQAIPGNPLALTFSEWNCLGFFLWEFHRDKVHWVLDSEAPPAVVYQGYSHGGESRKQEDLAKFKQLLEGPGDIDSGVVPDGPRPTSDAGRHDLTVSSAIEFLASQVKDNFHKARIIRDLKKAWKGKGEAPKTRSRGVSVQKNGTLKSQLRKVGLDTVSVIVEPSKTLLCIHSYPGANATVARHWLSYKKFGADRIVGIGTTDNECEWPEKVDDVVDIGENSYMKLKGKDDHLCRRLLDTVKWCLTQPEDRFAIIEYDTLPLKKMPKWKGVNASLTGGQINGSKAKSFFHNPWMFDRSTGPALVRAMEEVLPESQEYPNNSPDLFFGLACERAGIKVGCNFKLFTRNSLDAAGDLDLAVDAAMEGAHVIHGVKNDWEFNAITAALNGKHLALSHST